MLPSLAKTDIAYILLRSGREPGCGLSSLQRPRTSSGLGQPTDSDLASDAGVPVVQCAEIAKLRGASPDVVKSMSGSKTLTHQVLSTRRSFNKGGSRPTKPVKDFAGIPTVRSPHDCRRSPPLLGPVDDGAKTHMPGPYWQDHRLATPPDSGNRRSPALSGDRIDMGPASIRCRESD
jgi:hypothetical protein